MIELPYSLVIEATEEPDYFGFYSPDLEGFSGIGHSVEDCIYKAKWGMKEQTKSLWADGHFPVSFTGQFAKIDTDFLRIKRCCDYSTTEPYFYLFLLRIKAF